MKVLKPNTFLSVINDYYNYYFTVNDLSPITKGNYTSYYKGIESFLIKEEKFNVDSVDEMVLVKDNGVSIEEMIIPSEEVKDNGGSIQEIELPPENPKIPDYKIRKWKSCRDLLNESTINKCDSTQSI